MYYNLEGLKGYAHLRRWSPGLCDESLTDEVICDETDKKSTDSLLSIVYALDERTNLPTGDLGYLVSDKANPQVKEFILANLMQDVSSAKDIAANSSLSDDDILALSRNAGESIEEYASRLNESISRDKWLMDEYKRSISVKSSETPVSVK